MKSPILINSVEEINKVLFIQQAVTQAAEAEMLALISDDPEEYFAQESRLLAKYAGYPTLSEFRRNPQLTNVHKWGATFGVATLVDNLIVKEAQTLQPRFAPLLRRMYFIFLMELDQPKHKYLIDVLIDDFKDRVIVDEGTIDQKQKFVRATVGNILQTFILVSEQFGVTTLDKKQTSITPIGKRLLAHLADAARFIDSIGKLSISLYGEN